MRLRSYIMLPHSTPQVTLSWEYLVVILKLGQLLWNYWLWFASIGKLISCYCRLCYEPHVMLLQAWRLCYSQFYENHIANVMEFIMCYCRLWDCVTANFTKIILCYCQCYEIHNNVLLQAPNDRQLAGCDFGGLEGAVTQARTPK